MRGRKRTLEMLTVVGLILAAASCGSSQAKPPATKPPVMRKTLTSQGNFVLYQPEGWKAIEGVGPGYRTLLVTDASGTLQASSCTGLSPTGGDALSVARHFALEIRARFPDVQARKVMETKDANRATFGGVFTAPGMGRREFHAWVTTGESEFLCWLIEAPEGKLDANRALLLSVLSNVRLVKGAFAGREPLVRHRLGDGSATFLLPKDWKLQDYGKASFVASDPDGTRAFLVATVQMIPFQLMVPPPGVYMLPYMAPSAGFAKVLELSGLAKDVTLVTVSPRADLAGEMQKVYRAGPVTIEEFVYTFTSREGRKSKGFTFGVSFGSWVGAGWRLWHLTVTGPEETFDAFSPNYGAMMQSYRIGDEFAEAYVSEGMSKLRELQRQTMQKAARNATEIRETMQEAFNERNRSQDYIDYQRSNWLRHEGDWISEVEGGTVYHTDNWGTLNPETGTYYGGRRYDWVHFEGNNPRYREQMTPVDSRALWERHIRSR